MLNRSTQKQDQSPYRSKVMVVDDDEISRQLLREIFADKYEVVTCSSGKESLAKLDTFKPDLILMDAAMPEIDGYETCRRIRLKFTALPIIFVTSHQSLEEHLKAYEAGGNDLFTKPVDPLILLHKVNLAIQQKSDKEQLVHQVRSLQDMAMNFLSSSGESSILLNFVRNGGQAKSYESLAQHLLDAATEFGTECCIMLRHPDDQTIYTSHGEPSHLEMTIMEKMSGMGRLFEFKRQFIVNYDHVSIMITTSPQESPEKIGRIRDNTVILAESAQGLYEIVSMRIESMKRAEQMQIAVIAAGTAVEKVSTNHKRLLLDTRILLQQLVDKVESTYSRLNISRSDESEISVNMNESVDEILSLLSTENNFDDEIAKVHEALSVENKNNDNCLF